MFRLVGEGWEREVLGARQASPNGLRIVCPFIKAGTIRRILDAGSLKKPLDVITRFQLNCFYDGVSDLDALELLLRSGARVRGVRGLHAKLFLFGDATAIGTSANVTDAGMLRNHEFGFVTDDHDVVRECGNYFDRLWERAGGDLKPRQVREWRDVVVKARKLGGGKRPNLPDHGAKGTAGSPFTPPAHPKKRYDNQAFLKFFGRGSDRRQPDAMIADLVAESGCNWACTYPSSSRPRQVEDGDIVYMAWIVEPEDILIYGSAIGWRHRDDEDVASEEDIEAREWKADFSNYIRVHDGRFVDAELNVGVSMYEMLEALGPDAWRSTQDNARAGKGNTDPFASYLRKPAMQLTDASRAWIDGRLEKLFRRHGEVRLSAARFRPPA